MIGLLSENRPDERVVVDLSVPKSNVISIVRPTTDIPQIESEPEGDYGRCTS